MTRISRRCGRTSRQRGPAISTSKEQKVHLELDRGGTAAPRDAHILPDGIESLKKSANAIKPVGGNFPRLREDALITGLYFLDLEIPMSAGQWWPRSTRPGRQARHNLLVGCSRGPDGGVSWFGRRVIGIDIPGARGQEGSQRGVPAFIAFPRPWNSREAVVNKVLAHPAGDRLVIVGPSVNSCSVATTCVFKEPRLSRRRLGAQ
jgi:hypothetical protein